MTDRKPGAPGKCKAVVTADEFTKLQRAEPFSITLTRDDAPIAEGTPYSKAAVLPDSLAAQLCPNVADPTPADALRSLYTGKAPSGFGLGGVKAISAAELDTTVKPGWYRLNTAAGITIAGYTFTDWYVHVISYSDDYCVQKLYPLSSYGAELQRWRFKGVWSDGEWVNPLMVLGTEYRTQERRNWQQIYTKLIDFGALPNAASKSVETGVSSEKIIRSEARIISPSGYNVSSPYLLADGSLVLKHVFAGTKLEVTTTQDYSKGSAAFQIWYIKN